MVKCRKCPGLLFTSANLRDVHTRKVHKKHCLLTKSDGKKFSVCRSVLDNWVCPYPSCGSCFSRSDLLQSHYSCHICEETVRTNTSTLPDASLCSEEETIGGNTFTLPNDSCSEEAGAQAEQSNNQDILTKANLIVVQYESMTLLVCSTCNATLDCNRDSTIQSHVQKHVKEMRKNLRNQSRHETFDFLGELARVIGEIEFTPLEEVKQFVSNQNDPIAAIPGLLVNNGFSCLLCNYHCLKKKVMSNHRRIQHSEETNFVMSPSSVQCLFRGIGNKYFPVMSSYATQSLDSTIFRSALSASIARIEQSIHPQLEPPIAQLCPWLRVSCFSKYAAEIIPESTRFADVKDAMLLSEKDESPYSRLRDVLSLYLKLVRKTGSEVDFSVRLMVMEPGSTRGFTQFLKETTMDQYRPIMLGFLLCLLRSVCDPPSNLVHIVVAPDYLEDDLWQLKRQLEMLGRVPIEDDFDLTILHRLMICLWTPALGEVVRARRSTDSIFLRYMILFSLKKSGIDCYGYSFHHVTSVTPMLAMLKYWARATFLMEISQKLWNSRGRDMQIAEVKQLLQYLSENCLLETPFGFISHLQKLACTIQGDSPCKPQLVSSDTTYNTCSIGGYEISINGFRDTVNAVINDATMLMQQEVLLDLKTEWLEELLEGGRIVDDLNRKDVGYSFITDKVNPFHKHSHDLHDHLFQNQATRSHFINACSESGAIDWNKRSLSTWMSACSRLEDRLNLLLHFASGQPMRGTEYKSFLICNTGRNERSLYWSSSTLMTYQSYNKTCNDGKKPVKLIARFLPHCLRLVFLKYLCLVRPVQIHATGILHWPKGAAALYRDCWFVEMGKEREVRRVSQSLKREFSKHCNVPFGLKQYRHLATFYREPIRNESLAMQQEPLDESAGHTIATAGHVYAQNSMDLRSIDRHRMRGYQFISQKWHALLGLQGSVVLRVTRPPDLVVRPEPEVEIEIWPPRKRIRLLHNCQDSHRGENDPLEKIDLSTMDRARWALCELGHREWKSPEQATSVTLAMDNTQDFIAILPTGTGKSLVFMAPAVSSGKTVIVVVPLFMLIKSHLEECKSANIDCVEYKEGAVELTLTPPIVFVSVEIAIHDNFKAFAKQLKSLNRLHSIVIDEVHLVLCPFRPQMSQLLSLSTVDCQIIGLTASLAPLKENKIRMRMGRDFKVIRSGTARPNLAYRAIDAADIDSKILCLLREWIVNALSIDRVLVYCMTKGEVEGVHRYLQEHHLLCSSFLHSDLPGEERVGRLRKWEAGHYKIMVATGVIGCGYNYKFVRLVIHRGTFYSLESYHQESGRCARDGGSGICCVISNATYRERVLTKHKDKSPVNVQDLMRANNWIEDRGTCRRYNLHLDLDGRPENCLLIPHAVKCDVCSDRSQLARFQLGDLGSGSSQSEASGRGREDLRSLQTEGLERGCEAPVEVIVARPQALLVEKNIWNDKDDLSVVREHIGDGTQCLLCSNMRTYKSHAILECPKMRGLCARCCGNHWVTFCAIKKLVDCVQYKCCYKCFFQFEPIGDTSVHKPWGASQKCDDESGERMRILIWHTFRIEKNTVLELRKMFPDMPLEERKFEPWLVQKESDRMVNNFVRVGAAIIRMLLS